MNELTEQTVADSPAGKAGDGAPEAAPTEAAHAGHEMRVSTVVGDRLCAACGFNLTGQPVMKETTYNLFIVRCSECGTVASLQEYPVLGIWANRWASLVAAAWLTVIAAGALGLSVAFFVMSILSMELAADSVSSVIVDEWAATSEGQDAIEQIRPNRMSSSPILGPWVSIKSDWWEAQDPWALLARGGGARQLIMNPAAGAWSTTIIIGFVGGVATAVALLHAKRRRLAYLILLPIFIVATVQTAFFMRAVAPTGWSLTASQAARSFITPLTFALTDAAAYVGLLLGVLVGRPIIRMLVRAYLPPRLRSSLSILWLADGKAPPATGKRR